MYDLAPDTQPRPGAILDPDDPINTDLVEWWPMWEGAGGVVHGLRGVADGTLTNMDPATDWVAGRDGYALDFDGSNDRAQISKQVLVGNQWTISGWIKPARYGNYNYGNGVYHQGAAGATLGTNVCMFTGATSTNSIGGRTNSSSAWCEIQSNVIVLNTWQHVAMVNNAGAVSWYVNGQPRGTSSGDAGVADVADNAYIGTWYDGSAGRSYQGQITNLRCHNRVLTASEAAELHAHPWSGLWVPSGRTYFGYGSYYVPQIISAIG